MSFNFFVKSNIDFGRGALADLSGIIEGYHLNSVMVVYDGGVKAAGIADKVVAEVEKAGVSYSIFDGVIPNPLLLENGNTVCLPYLAAIVRLADEVNVDQNRNTKLMFDPEKASTDKQRMENAKHQAIKKMNIYPDRIELDVKTDGEGDYHLSF